MLWNDDLLNSVNLLFFWSVVGLNVFGLLVTQVPGVRVPSRHAHCKDSIGTP